MKWRNLHRTQFDILEKYKKKTPYELLGVDPSASLEVIGKAYIRLMNAYHPDRADAFLKKTNEEITKLINVAYESILREKNAPR